VPLGKYTAKRRIWERIVWRERRADYVKDRSSELQRGISK